jgi:hypothetical protein
MMHVIRTTSLGDFCSVITTAPNQFLAELLPVTQATDYKSHPVTRALTALTQSIRKRKFVSLLANHISVRQRLDS